MSDRGLDDHFAEACQAFLKGEIRLPNLDFPVASGGDEFTCPRIVKREGAATMSREFLHLTAVVHFPENHLAIF